MADGTKASTDTAEQQLFKAMARAQASAKGVEKDGWNQHNRYGYASAEAIIRETKPDLAAEGFSIIPLSSEIIVNPLVRETTNKDGKPVNLGSVGTLRTTFMLCHVGGHSVKIARDWPIVPENGRPSDKAVAGADTASLGYFLRDLLLLPRVEPGTDLDADTREHHDDRPVDPVDRKLVAAKAINGAAQRISKALDVLNITGQVQRDNAVKAVLKRDPVTDAELAQVAEALEARASAR
jgi:hypothetical protein